MTTPAVVSPTRQRGRMLRASGVAGLILIAGAAAAQGVAFGDTAAASAQPIPVECGNMQVGYHVVSSVSNSAAGVDAVTLSNVAKSCAGHSLTVEVRDGSHSLASGSLKPVASQGTYTVQLDTVAPVASISSVSVLTPAS